MATPGPNVRSEAFITAEFKRLAGRKKNYLVLEELLRFQAKGATIPVDLNHLGVLFVLDRDHDGKVTLDDLLAFASFCRRSRSYQSFEYAAQLQGLCSLQLWLAMCAPNGQENYVNWISALLLENSPERRRFWRYGTNQSYLHVDTITHLYHLLRVQDTVGVDFQGFFDLLQRVGEERKLMDLKDEEQDNWVPLSVIKDFIAGMFRGAHRLMSDICPVDELPPDIIDL